MSTCPDQGPLARIKVHLPGKSTTQSTVKWTSRGTNSGPRRAKSEFWAYSWLPEPTNTSYSTTTQYQVRTYPQTRTISETIFFVDPRFRFHGQVPRFMKGDFKNFKWLYRKKCKTDWAIKNKILRDNYFFCTFWPFQILYGFREGLPAPLFSFMNAIIWRRRQQKWKIFNGRILMKSDFSECHQCDLAHYQLGKPPGSRSTCPDRDLDFLPLLFLFFPLSPSPCLAGI